MTQMRKVLAVTEETTLLPFLLREVTGKSRNTVKGLLTRRQVMVDGTVVTRRRQPGRRSSPSRCSTRTGI